MALFFGVLLLTTSISFSMQEVKGDTITINLQEQCSVCLDTLSVKKGAIVTLGCRHSYHLLCHQEWQRKCQRKTCFCNSPLLNFDEKEDSENYNKFFNPEHTNSNNASSVYRVCSFTLEMIKHGYWALGEVYRTNEESDV